jgi:hypothetical protein
VFALLPKALNLTTPAVTVPTLKVFGLLPVSKYVSTLLNRMHSKGKQ